MRTRYCHECGKCGCKGHDSFELVKCGKCKKNEALVDTPHRHIDGSALCYWCVMYKMQDDIAEYDNRFHNNDGHTAGISIAKKTNRRSLGRVREQY